MNTEISNQFVSYEIAVRLKELGFNEPCFATYNKLTNGKIDLLPKKFGVNEMASLVSAPLWQQCFDWIELNYGIGLVPFPVYRDKKIGFYKVNVSKYNESVDTDDFFGFMKDTFLTLNEAREIAVLKAIELIEKQK